MDENISAAGAIMLIASKRSDSICKIGGDIDAYDVAISPDGTIMPLNREFDSHNQCHSGYSINLLCLLLILEIVHYKCYLYTKYDVVWSHVRNVMDFITAPDKQR